MDARKRTLALSAVGLACLLALTSAIGWSRWRREFQLPSNENCGLLERLVVSDAPLDAARNAQRGDTHLIGVQGYTIQAPGLPDDHGDELPSNYRVLSCTSDGVVSHLHDDLNNKASAYAAAYNRATLSIPGAPAPEYAVAPGH